MKVRSSRNASPTYHDSVTAPRFEGDPFRAGVAGEGTNLDTSQL